MKKKVENLLLGILCFVCLFLVGLGFWPTRCLYAPLFGAIGHPGQLWDGQWMCHVIADDPDEAAWVMYFVKAPEFLITLDEKQVRVGKELVQQCTVKETPEAGAECFRECLSLWGRLKNRAKEKLGL